jgi:hypothetical protein
LSLPCSERPLGYTELSTNGVSGNCSREAHSHVNLTCNALRADVAHRKRGPVTLPRVADNPSNWITCGHSPRACGASATLPRSCSRYDFCTLALAVVSLGAAIAQSNRLGVLRRRPRIEFATIAEDIRLGRLVALKFLPEAGTNPGSAPDFLRDYAAKLNVTSAS